MDCLTFRKNINAYIADELTDDELNEFLGHLSSCEKCREELEINYIVNEGISLLDENDRHDYNISHAYEEALENDRRHIRLIYVLRIFTYSIDTLVFWSVLFCALIFLRILLV